MNSKLMYSLVCLLVFSFMTGCGTSGEQPTPTPVLDGEELLQTRCTECHTLSRVEREALTRDQWEKVVEDMIIEGTILQTVEKEVLLDYLAETYPAP